MKWKVFTGNEFGLTRINVIICDGDTYLQTIEFNILIESVGMETHSGKYENQIESYKF